MKTLTANFWLIGIILAIIGIAINWYAALKIVDAKKKKNYFIIGTSIALLGVILFFIGTKNK